MKVNEIIEFLSENNKKCSKEDLLMLLDNVGIEGATEETDIDTNVLKKLSKKFGVDIKPKKIKKEVKAKPTKSETTDNTNSTPTTEKSKTDKKIDTTEKKPLKVEKTDIIDSNKVANEKKNDTKTKEVNSTTNTKSNTSNNKNTVVEKSNTNSINTNATNANSTNVNKTTTTNNTNTNSTNVNKTTTTNNTNTNNANVNKTTNTNSTNTNNANVNKTTNTNSINTSNTSKTSNNQNQNINKNNVPTKKDANKDNKKDPRRENNTKKDIEENDEVYVEGDNVELTRRYDDKYDSYEKGEKQYTRLRNVKKNKKMKTTRQSNTQINKAKTSVVYYEAGMTAGALADSLGVSYGEIVKKLVGLGYMVAATQPIDRDVVEILADDYGFSLKDKVVYDITKFEDMVIDEEEENLESRPPIVTIMGHVDHGKTTLLDTIRSSRVVATEAGGITQKIGAYQVNVKDKKITFIDTPGHAAFTEMRARGAMVTDIVILVVAADDGVMPQTKEAIDHAQAAKVPIIVAVNKIDKAGSNPDRVKQELSALGLTPSEWGGETEFVNISALKGQGVDELLDTIVFVAEIQNYRANPNRLGYGTVIEAQLTKGKGPVATLLVKNGTIKIGDPIVVGTTYGKIRAMQDETKANLKAAGPAKAVEITGLVDVPQAGDNFMIFEDEKTAKLISEERLNRQINAKNANKGISLAAMFENLDSTEKEINLIIKGDLQGSVEALTNSLNKLSVEGVKVNIVSTGVGTVNDNDITLAVASKSIIIGFNIRPNSAMTKQANDRGVEIRLYNIIYKLLEDIEAAMKGMLDPVFEEKVIGEVEVRKIFKVSKIGTIAGSYVTNGIVTRNSQVRLIRNGIVVYTGKIGTLKRAQDDVKEVKQGLECGITIQNFNDIKEGDIIEAFIMAEINE